MHMYYWHQILWAAAAHAQAHVQLKHSHDASRPLYNGVDIISEEAFPVSLSSSISTWYLLSQIHVTYIITYYYEW